MEMLKKEELKKLYNRYLHNTCSPEELQILADQIAEGSPWVHELLTQTWDEMEKNPQRFHVPETELFVINKKQLKFRKVNIRHIKRISYYTAAASIVLFLGISLYFLWPPPTIQKKIENIVKADFSPGKNKAVLTLANGANIILDSLNKAVIAQQAGTRITQTNKGELVYHTEKAARKTQYNTLTTPRGGLYKLTLPDGSKVWINAAASLRFPIAFRGTKREVFLTGEAYFEVRKNMEKPFIVHTSQSRIEVLGTHFNVKAYNDEPTMSATLAEGSIRFSSDKSQWLLKPNQQIKLDKESGKTNVSKVNALDAIAWTHGEISLNDIGLDDLMRQISRWYDVDIEIKGSLPQRKFQGVLRRDVNLSYVIEALNANGINVRLDGKKIVLSEK